MSRRSLVIAAAGVAVAIAGSALRGQQVKNAEAAALKNPVAATPQSLAAGRRQYDALCAACHGSRGEGAVKAGTALSIIEEQGGRQAPDLTDAQTDHGSTDGEIFTVIKRGVPATMMPGWDGRIADRDIWSLVHYIRAMAEKKEVAAAPAASAADRTPRPRLDLADYAALPITGELAGEATRGLLARVNFMRDEPGGRRFFVNDLNGPLYLLDKKTKQFTTYLDFNGLGDRTGLFGRLTFERNLATGLINVVLDPDYARNGVFYTIHMEDPTVDASAAPKPGAAAGLDASGYQTTPALPAWVRPGTRITREAVMIEWTDRNIANTTFEGTARELLRMELASPIHPLGEMTFNPAARPGEPDWRVMYVGAGDAGTGEQRDVRRLTPQRLDNLNGKILRIIPDLREHQATSTVSENGRYRIPNDNPFAAVDGARKEIWAVGLRNPHRLAWDVDPARPREPRLIAFNIGLTAWETVMIVKKGANYGYPLREGPQAMTPAGMAPVPADDTIPVQITDTVARGAVKPDYPVIAYPHTQAGGDAIAGGFVYRGKRLPALAGKLIFADITTGRIWYADIDAVRSADDGNPSTLAPIHEIETGLRGLVEKTFRARGAKGEFLPGTAAISGRGRVDVRLAEDNDGELYVLTKSDGMIRHVVGFK